MDEYGIADHGHQVNNDLLTSFDLVDIDSVETTLGSSTTREEKTVDEGNATDCVEHARPEQSHTANVEVMNRNEVESSLRDQVRQPLLDRIQHRVHAVGSHDALSLFASHWCGFLL